MKQNKKEEKKVKCKIRWQKSKMRISWQQGKHAKQYSDLPQGVKRESVIGLDSHLQT